MAGIPIVTTRYICSPSKITSLPYSWKSCSVQIGLKITKPRCYSFWFFPKNCCVISTKNHYKLSYYISKNNNFTSPVARKLRYYSTQTSTSHTDNALKQRVRLFTEEQERQSRKRSLNGPINIQLPDGQNITSDDPNATLLTISEKIGYNSSSNPIVAAMLSTCKASPYSHQNRDEGEKVLTELNSYLADIVAQSAPDATTIQVSKWIYFEDTIGKQIFWHSSAHILGAAVEMLHFPEWDSEQLKHTYEGPFSNLKLTEVSKANLEGRIVPLLDDGPPLDEKIGGFYYDFYIAPNHLKEDTFPKLEKLAKNIIKKNCRFQKLEISRQLALEMFSYNPFKIAGIHKIPQDEKITVYRCEGTPFIDLCRGPHLPHAGLAGSFQIVKSSGAYYHGNNSNPYLQRIYGMTFPTENQLSQWIHDKDEAARRDHRLIGKQQSLFMFHEFSPGSPFFLPHGTRIFNKLVDAIRKEYVTRGYAEVITPLVFDKQLWKTSGHWQHYKENMFMVSHGCGDLEHHMEHTAESYDRGAEKAPSNGETVDANPEEKFFSSGLKPMNCPGHCLTFKAEPKSYRDLPVRYSDFSSLHRNEVRGTLTGLTRVRRFHQDDAHIFCTHSQIEEELKSVMAMVDHFYGKVFGFPYEILVSTRPEKSMGSDQDWQIAEQALMSAVKSTGRSYVINQGDGAFYGPKIDFVVTDALKRKHQCATIQLDFQLPQRFALSYVDATGSHQTPVIIHRAVLGSIERMFAMLVEHYGGKWPLWLSPRQIGICAISKLHVDYVMKIYNDMKKDGFFAELFVDDQTIGNKIRQAQNAQCNYILVIGNAEIEKNVVNVRLRDNTVVGEMKLDDLKSRLQAEIADWK